MQIIVLFNLKPGADTQAYEHWARARDLPGVRALGSVKGYDILRATGLLFRNAPSPYAYIERIEVTDCAAFLTDCGGAAVQALAGEMAAFAADPVFIAAEPLDATA